MDGWSPKHGLTACRRCGSDERPHVAKGMCGRCLQLERRLRLNPDGVGKHRGRLSKVSEQLQQQLPDPNPSGKCLCGCGGDAPIAPFTHKSRGWVKGKHVRYITGHAAMGWNRLPPGTKRVGTKGYIWIKAPGHSEANKRGWALEHRKVLADKLGRPLLPGEEAHHKDDNHANNAPDNIELKVTHDEHMQTHARRHWSRKYPHLTGCKVCGSTEPHAGLGMCQFCYDQYRRGGMGGHGPKYKGDRWSRHHDACVSCRRTDSRHAAHGLCDRCYQRAHPKERNRRKRTV